MDTDHPTSILSIISELYEGRSELRFESSDSSPIGAYVENAPSC